MKPTKMRNNTIYRAANMVRSKQLGSPLSKELRQKYGKRSIRIMEGDTVKITRGEFRGIDGKVSQVSIAKNSVAVEGVKKEKAKGDKFDVFIHTSKVLITGLNDKDKWRMEKLEGKKGKLAKSKPKEESETNVKKQKETKSKTKEMEDEE